jgi:ribosomal protein L24E
VAQAAATWLVAQQAPDGSIGGSLSATVNGILALAAANNHAAAAKQALSYVESNVSTYITADSADGPGRLANLILDAHVMGVDPTSFAGTNLVSRLLATEQTAGADAGLFGTETQLNDYLAGTFIQGLDFSALAAVGRAPDAAAVHWLLNQQCSSGGWVIPAMADTSCTYDPSSFSGADNQTTSVVLQGLAAQGQLPSAVSSAAVSFLTVGQDPDGGWSYYSNSVAQPQQTDSQSTGLVTQALVALGLSPTSPTFVKAGHSPVSVLLSFVITSGPNAGALGYQDNTTSNVLATNQDIPVLMGFTIPFGPVARSYWAVSSSGAVFSFGGPAFHGSLGGVHLNKPVVGMATTPDGLGYWLVASDGGVFTFGNAAFYGSTGALKLNKPIVGMAATPDGTGYWLVASDGGIFAFGSAAFLGSTGSLTLNRPIVGMAATPDGAGYWLVASDGGIFAFGSAAFHGSTGSLTLNKPIVGMAATPDGAGYWLVASDGGIFAFGTSVFHGSTGSLTLNKPIVGMAATPDGLGYWLVASDGGIFTFGSATYSGSAAPYGVSDIVGLSAAFA